MTLISIIDGIKSFFTKKIKARKAKKRAKKGSPKVISIHRKARS